MKLLTRLIKWVGIVLGVILLLVFITGFYLYNKDYEAPLPDIHASKDSAVIAHGKHIVYSTAHCIECHYKPEDSLKVANGEEAVLAGGGFPFIFPGGKFYSPNISNDEETGIGKLTDQQIARTIRYGVKSDNSALIPAMEYHNASDEDLTAIISYLRTSPPVKYKVPDNEFNLIGKGILAFFIRPQSPAKPPPLKFPPDTTVEYGKYIAVNLSQCRGCHTQRDMNTGAYIGEELAGGVVEELREDPTKVLVAPNLTPDPKTGHIYSWTYEQFKNRFSLGKLLPQSIMPWGQFKQLNETELLAIWKYLHSVPAVFKDNGPVIQYNRR